MASAGYSGTPLAQKLGITEGTTVAVVDDPGHFQRIVAPLPGRIELRSSARGKADIAIFFTKRRSRLERRIESLGRLIYPAGRLWIAWPKRASKVPTDITEDVVREVVLPLGLVDVKVAAIDDVWSGLAIVWRKENR